MKQLIFITMSIVLASCSDFSIPGFGPAKDDIVAVPVSDARILFGAPAFSTTPPVRLKFTDGWQREEYALFQGPGSQAEVVYIAATALETSLEYEIGLKSRITSWNYNSNAKIVWGAQSKAFSAFGEVFYQPYERGQDACFGFSAELAVAMDDPELNPTKAVFGYYCETSETALSTDRVEALIDRIEVSRFAAGNTLSAPPKNAVNRSGGDTGNPDFPFVLARGYQSEGLSFVDRNY
ncbi:MAG: hypothetical protein GKS00_23175 [Alphaproteobacteria bacterium]|nr:hypothetical protein [Alphaproteobacteria bacterium]